MKLIKTCSACPSQWEGQLDSGLFMYVRYRWGRLQIGIGYNINTAVRDYTVSLDIGDPFDGDMSDDTMYEYLDKYADIIRKKEVELCGTPL